MAEHPNATLARKGYEAFAKGDMDTIRELFSPDIVWHSPGNNPLSGDYKGIEEVLGFFGKIISTVTFQQNIHDIVANDEHTCVLIETTLTKGDESLIERGVHILHSKEGKVTEFWNFSENQPAVDAILS